MANSFFSIYCDSTLVQIQSFIMNFNIMAPNVPCLALFVKSKIDITFDRLVYVSLELFIILPRSPLRFMAIVGNSLLFYEFVLFAISIRFGIHPFHRRSIDIQRDFPMWNCDFVMRLFGDCDWEFVIVPEPNDMNAGV